MDKIENLKTKLFETFGVLPKNITDLISCLEYDIQYGNFFIISGIDKDDNECVYSVYKDLNYAMKYIKEFPFPKRNIHLQLQHWFKNEMISKCIDYHYNDDTNTWQEDTFKK